MPPVFSVIVPAYNSEGHIADCLKSVLNQRLFGYLECNLASLLGPTNNRVQAYLPSGILMLCR